MKLSENRKLQERPFIKITKYTDHRLVYHSRLVLARRGVGHLSYLVLTFCLFLPGEGGIDTLSKEEGMVILPEVVDLGMVTLSGEVRGAM